MSSFKDLQMFIVSFFEIFDGFWSTIKIASLLLYLNQDLLDLFNLNRPRVGPVGPPPPLSISIANVLWTEISTSTTDGFSSWRYWYCLQKSDILFIINFLKKFPFFNNFCLKMTAKNFFTILQNQNHLGELNPGLPGERQLAYH